MSADPLPAGLEPRQLLEVIAAARAQVETALWLSAGMACAFASLLCAAAGWRRAGLACGLLYSATLCLVSNGQARVLGPLGCAVALVGLIWPERRPVR